MRTEFLRGKLYSIFPEMQGGTLIFPRDQTALPLFLPESALPSFGPE